MVTVKSQRFMLSGTLLLASLVSLGMFAAGALFGESDFLWFMIWNLFLAWLPLVFMLWLLRTLRRKRWSSWQGISLSLLWLGFLPNSFYMVTDYMHLRSVPSDEVVYNSVMLTSFILNGLLLGYVSLYLFHRELRKRLPGSTARGMVATVLLLCSFAIYLGRELRWNTWDVLLNPAGLLFDISNRFISPMSYPQMFVTTAAFFVLLTTVYYVIWNLIRALRQSEQ